jgi:hypothetical protein
MPYSNLETGPYRSCLFRYIFFKQFVSTKIWIRHFHKNIFKIFVKYFLKIFNFFNQKFLLVSKKICLYFFALSDFAKQSLKPGFHSHTSIFAFSHSSIHPFENQINWSTIFNLICIDTRAWSYQQKFSDLRNVQKKSEKFKPIIFVRKVKTII